MIDDFINIVTSSGVAMDHEILILHIVSSHISFFVLKSTLLSYLQLALYILYDIVSGKF